LRRKGRVHPFAILTELILLFGKKKPPEEQVPASTTSLEPFPIPDTIRKTITESDIAKARNRLRVANLERDIIGDALTKIYEAEAKGTINEPEKNDLYELEAAKEDLFKRFQETFLDIQARIEKIRPSLNLPTSTETKPTEPNPAPTKTEPTEPIEQNAPPKEKPPREKARNKAEEKIETIREEVLKAMERLEQIETEG